jgi:hypothetical protein
MSKTHNEVKDVLGELHGGSLGGHMGINKTLDKVRQWYYCLHESNNVER